MAGSAKNLAPRVEAVSAALASSASSRATPIPIPPPPITAFTINGNPKSAPAATASSADDSGPALGSTGNPLFSKAFRQATLSPASSSTSGGGPTQTSPASVTASASFGDSDRNPYPGCTASA